MPMSDHDWSKPAAVAIPKEGYFELGRLPPAWTCHWVRCKSRSAGCSSSPTPWPAGSPATWSRRRQHKLTTFCVIRRDLP